MSNTIIKGNVFIIPNGIHEGKVQVWFTSDESENWTDHSHPRIPNRIPNNLPIELFEGKVEGDTVTFDHDDLTIELVLNQSDYRYRRFGQFEEVLESLIARQTSRDAA